MKLREREIQRMYNYYMISIKNQIFIYEREIVNIQREEARVTMRWNKKIRILEKKRDSEMPNEK